MSDEEIAAKIDTAIETAQAKLKEHEEAGLIDPLNNMDGAPVFIHTGGKDGSMPPANQLAQQGLMESYGANVEYLYDANAAHNMDKSVPGEIFQHLYGFEE